MQDNLPQSVQRCLRIVQEGLVCLLAAWALEGIHLAEWIIFRTPFEFNEDLRLRRVRLHIVGDIFEIDREIGSNGRALNEVGRGLK
jgi:hypothetical protein